MPIPKTKSGESQREYISRCISAIYDEYPSEGQPFAICKATWDKETMSSEEFADYPWDVCIADQKKAGYTEEVANKICGSIKARNMSSKEFARTKFEFPPEAKETMTSFMARCMSNDRVRERKQDRAGRAAFCYGNYQNRYIASLAKRWK